MKAVFLVLRPDDLLARAFQMFRKTKADSLPVTSGDGRFLGVVRLRDIAGADPADKVAGCLSADCLQVRRPVADEEILRDAAVAGSLHTEVYVVDPDGKLVACVDLRQLQKAWAAGAEIADEEQFLKQILRPTSLARCILDDLNDGVILVNRESRILYANSSYGRILGIDHTKVIGRLLTVIEPGSRLMEVLATGQPFINKPIELKRLNVTVMARITPIRFRNEVVAAVSVFSDISDTLRAAADLEKAQHIRELLAEELAPAGSVPPEFADIVGSSRKLRRQLDIAMKVAPVDAPLLILGESGTGKELLARAIHRISPRRDNPFLSLNCSAIPDNLMESELFGYEEGAFTGSRKGGKVGKIEVANRGTLLLDEIGDMPMTMQTKLLRFLQEKEFERVGGVSSVKVDIRVLAATNRDLDEMVRQKTFREDLYYRLNVFTLTVPPLRERRVDIPALVEHYKAYYEAKYSKKVEISPRCLKVLTDHDWPGNVRELKNVMEHVVLLAETPVVGKDHLPTYFRSALAGEGLPRATGEAPGTLTDRINQLEKTAILEALQESGYNRSKAMKLLGLSRRTFYKRLRELGI